MGSPLSRRRLLAAGAAATGLAVLPGRALGGPSFRFPESLPDPRRPPGTPDPRIPVDHVVVLMMENHSFDNYFGMLSRRGQLHADGFRFDGRGRPTDTNPVHPRRPWAGDIRAFRMPSACQMEHEPDQSWNGTHRSVDGGAMDGFVAVSGDVAMGYWDDADLPFYYSLASTFTLANRWFSSAPCQTYPNRRFLMAGTAYGLVSSTVPSPTDPPPPHGTIFDRLNAHGLSWKNYAADLPQTAIIPSVVLHNPGHIATTAQFLADAAAGSLPAVSFVDPDFGLLDVIGGLVPGQPVPPSVRAQGTDEENPQNIRWGEAFAARIVNAVLASPAWPRTMLVWLYDEHGGYYDHVPPPRAVRPDGIDPRLGPDDVPGRYDRYGPRVPAVVVSPWSRPHAVTDTVHDHTSILAFIEQKWNLPALTRRDANAHSLLDFLDLRRPRLLDPPTLATPADPVAADRTCSTADPHAPVERKSRAASPGAPARAAGHHPAGSASQGSARAADGALPATGGDPLVWPAAGALAAGGIASVVRRALSDD